MPPRLVSFRVLRFFFVLIAVSQLAVEGSDFDKARFAPYGSWYDSVGESVQDSAEAFEVWWLTPDQARVARGHQKLPLSGIHFALDPGHVGGAWAEVEGRHFRIYPEDHAVREGELVLEVAFYLEAHLRELGAEVSLLRQNSNPVNTRPPLDYLAEAMERVQRPGKFSVASCLEYARSIRTEILYLSGVVEELTERARLVNGQIRPDALISLHINAGRWPLEPDGTERVKLLDSNHCHVLIFGCVSDAEFSSPSQRRQILKKMANGSASIEIELGDALGKALGQAMELPPSEYNGKNAVRLAGATPYLWARNLMLLRSVECPVVLLEPFLANSVSGYARLQQSIEIRKAGGQPGKDDLLVRYADAVVEGLLRVYGPKGP